MFIPSYPTLNISSFIRKEKNMGADHIVGRKISCFRRGRDALWWGINSLRLQPGDNILLPASVCGAVIQPTLSLNLDIKLYDLDDTLKYSIPEIETLIDSRTKAILIVHYFGFPQNPEKIREFCDRNGLFLIEDCALSLMGKHKGTPLGHYGDISIFSPRKFLPLSDGGFLASDINDNTSLSKIQEWDKIGSLKVLSKLLTLNLAQKGLVPIGLLKKLIKTSKTLGDENIHGDFDDRYHLNMSKINSWLITRFNIKEIAEERRNNYNFWLNQSKVWNEYYPLFGELPAGIVPYQFPVSIPKYATQIVESFKNNGIFLEMPINAPFYQSPNLLNNSDRFVEIEEMSKHIIGLPVHQSLNMKSLKKMKTLIEEIIGS